MARHWFASDLALPIGDDGARQSLEDHAEARSRIPLFLSIHDPYTLCREIPHFGSSTYRRHDMRATRLSRPCLSTSRRTAFCCCRQAIKCTRQVVLTRDWPTNSDTEQRQYATKDLEAELLRRRSKQTRRDIPDTVRSRGSFGAEFMLYRTLLRSPVYSFGLDSVGWLIDMALPYHLPSVNQLCKSRLCVAMDFESWQSRRSGCHVGISRTARIRTLSYASRFTPSRDTFRCTAFQAGKISLF